MQVLFSGNSLQDVANICSRSEIKMFSACKFNTAHILFAICLSMQEVTVFACLRAGDKVYFAIFADL